jgi:hypothetical protein
MRRTELPLYLHGGATILAGGAIVFLYLVSGELSLYLAKLLPWLAELFLYLAKLYSIPVAGGTTC